MTPELFIIKGNSENTLCYKQDEEYHSIVNPMISFKEGEDLFEIIQPDESYKTKTYKYQGRKVLVEPTLYENNWPAILVLNPRDKDDFECLTTNLEGDTMAFGIPDRTFIDINNHPKAMKFLIENGFVEDIKYSRQSGFVKYPMVWINISLLYQHNPEPFKEYLKSLEQQASTQKVANNINTHLSNNDAVNPTSKNKGKTL